MKQITNNELFALNNILSGLTVCAPSIVPDLSGRLIDLVCEIQDAAEKLQKKIETIRKQTQPEGVEEAESATEEQREAWNRAMGEQAEILGAKESTVQIELLTPEQFRAAVSASTLTGAAVVALRRMLVAGKQEVAATETE